MGGKIWTAAEEDVFWIQIVPQSYHRLGADRIANPGRDWADLGQDMRNAMTQYYGARGDEIPRDYTGQSLYEHWDRNVHRGPSRYARQYVEAYRAQAAADGVQIGRRPHKAKKSLAKVPTNVDETDTDNEGALEGSTTIATPVATTSRRHIQTPAKDCGNLGEDSNEDEDGPPRSAKRRRVGNRRVVIDQTHPRLVRRREELLRLAPEEQEASPSATVAYNQPPAVDHREGLGTATEDRNAVMPPMTYGDFDERVNRHVEARLAEFLASQREQILRDFDGRLAEHLANFSNRLASGVRATEAGPPRSPSRLTNAAPPSLPAARHSLPTLRPAAGARQVFQTTASGIPFIYPPSHNPALRHPSGISTSIQPSPSVTSSTPARRSANNTAGRAPAIPAPDGSPEAPVIVPTSSDDDTPEKKKEQEGEEM